MAAWPLKRRIALCLGVAVVAGAWSAISHLHRGSDFALVIRAAEAWLSGQDPYLVAKHGTFPLLYPFTAVLFGVPFVYLPYPDFWFIAIGVGLYLWGVSGSPRLQYASIAVLTPAMIQMVRVSQWPALLTGAAVMPSLGFLLACKPTIGAALWCAFPSRRTLIGGAVFGAVSVALYPAWPWRWLETLQSNTAHMQAPITLWGGPLILLALTRWRMWEARLLVAMACVPQTHFYYDAWPLWLIPRTGEQAAWLTGAAWLMASIQVASTGAVGNLSEAAYMAERQVIAQLSIVFLYLPCLWFVLRRSDDPGGPPCGERQAVRPNAADACTTRYAGV